MMISDNDINKICERTLADMNIASGCRFVVESIHSGNTNSATNELAKIISLSISRCLSDILKEYDSSIRR